MPNHSERHWSFSPLRLTRCPGGALRPCEMEGNDDMELALDQSKAIEDETLDLVVGGVSYHLMKANIQIQRDALANKWQQLNGADILHITQIFDRHKGDYLGFARACNDYVMSQKGNSQTGTLAYERNFMQASRTIGLYMEWGRNGNNIQGANNAMNVAFFNYPNTFA